LWKHSMDISILVRCYDHCDCVFVFISYQLALIIMTNEPTKYDA
jgi:hypothetical protein